MKLTMSGVTFSAAMVRSPSFSRSSSSTTTTMRPWRMSSTASSIVANWLCSSAMEPASNYSAIQLGQECRDDLGEAPGNDGRGGEGENPGGHDLSADAPAHGRDPPGGPPP